MKTHWRNCSKEITAPAKAGTSSLWQQSAREVRLV